MDLKFFEHYYLKMFNVEHTNGWKYKCEHINLQGMAN